jgi:hypothetical protein
VAGAVFVASVHLKVAVYDLPTDIDDRIHSALSAHPECRGLIERPIGCDLSVVTVNSNLGGKRLSAMVSVAATPSAAVQPITPGRSGLVVHVPV